MGLSILVFCILIVFRETWAQIFFSDRKYTNLFGVVCNEYSDRSDQFNSISTYEDEKPKKGISCNKYS